MALTEDVVLNSINFERSSPNGMMARIQELETPSTNDSLRQIKDIVDGVINGPGYDLEDYISDVFNEIDLVCNKALKKK